MTKVFELLSYKKDKASKIVSKLVDIGFIKQQRADCGKAFRTYVTELSEHVDECMTKKRLLMNGKMRLLPVAILSKAGHVLPVHAQQRHTQR
jgi:hypothetical protein